MKIIITESQYLKILNEDVSSDKGCKIWVESESDPKYKRYLIEYKVYMDAYKLAKQVFPMINNISDYDAYHDDMSVDPRYTFKDAENKKRLSRPTTSHPYYSRFNEDNLKVVKMVKDNIKKYNIEPGSLGYDDVYIPLYKKPKKVCIKPIQKKQEQVPSPISQRKSQTTTEFTPKPDDTSVYGPSNSLIGFMRGKDFIPASGKYTVGMNKLDRELLNNKVELNKYIQSKFGQFANIIN